ncbi:MAG: hypothetical protein GMKNLPBB_01683 [Myxococcota bacterium]|nr:hypothetical protein [Myxococcota bacterium]
MKIWLMRHGLAQDREDPRCPPDPDRRLVPEGIRKTRLVVRGLAALGASPRVIASSPYLRARETAGLVMEGLGVESRLELCEPLVPHGDPFRAAADLKRLCSGADILAAGHAPNLDLLIGVLTLQRPTAVTLLKKSAVACLDWDLESGRAQLAWLMGPKQFKALLDPGKH